MTFSNLAGLPIGSLLNMTEIRYASHYSRQKHAVQLKKGSLYQAGEFLENSIDELLSGYKITIEKCRFDSS